MNINLDDLTKIMGNHLTVRVIHEWRSGHADPMAQFERGMQLMNDITTRLTASVDNLAVALGNQGSAIGEVASAIRNHPATTTDNGALSALADRLDQITQTVNDSATQLHGLAGEENVEDGAASPAPQEPAPVDPTASAGTSDTPTGDTGAPADANPDATTDASASDGSTVGEADTASGDGFQQPDTDTANNE
jgi:hypothetical protein